MTLPSLTKLHKSCQATSPIKLYAALSSAAFSKGKQDHLALWSILRSLDTLLFNGCGDLVFPSVEVLVYLLQDFGYTRRTAFRHLNKGNGEFWRLCHQKGSFVVKIYGLKTVCLALDTFLNGDRHARLVTREQFNTLAKRRSQIYASIHKPEGVRSNPITRQKVQELTKVSRVSQWRYDKTAGIKKTNNFEVDYRPGDNTAYAVTMEVKGKRRLYNIPRRLGNTYHTQQEAGHKGQTRNVSKALKASKASLLSEKALKVNKCFHSSLSGVVRYLKGHQDIDSGFYLVRNNKRLIKGRMEWSLHTTGNGCLYA